MRLVAAAVMAMACFATSALAQETPAEPAGPVGPPNPPSRCAAFPAAPAVPGPEVTDRAQRDAAYTAYRTWGVAMQGVLACRRTEAQEARRQYDALTQEHNDGVEVLRRTSEAFVASAGGTAAAPSGQR